MKNFIEKDHKCIDIDGIIIRKILKDTCLRFKLHLGPHPKSYTVITLDFYVSIPAVDFKFDWPKCAGRSGNKCGHILVLSATSPHTNNLFFTGILASYVKI